MAFSGIPITHTFGMTAFGRPKRPFSEVEPDVDQPAVIRYKKNPNRFYRHLEDALPYPDSDDDDARTGGPSARWSPSRGIVQVSKKTAGTGKGQVSSGNADREVAKEDKPGEQDDKGHQNAANGNAIGEIIEISSGEEEEVDTGSDVGKDDDLAYKGHQRSKVNAADGANPNNGETSTLSSTSTALQVCSAGQHEDEMQVLAAHVPRQFLLLPENAKKYKESSRRRVWDAALRYVEHLVGVTVLSKDPCVLKTNTSRNALFKKFKHDYKSQVGLNGKMLADRENIKGLIQQIIRFLHLSTGTALCAAASGITAGLVVSTKVNTSSTHEAPSASAAPAPKDSQLSKTRNSVHNEGDPDAYIKELPIPDAPKRKGRNKAKQKSIDDGKTSASSHNCLMDDNTLTKGAVSSQKGFVASDQASATIGFCEQKKDHLAVDQNDQHLELQKLFGPVSSTSPSKKHAATKTTTSKISAASTQPTANVTAAPLSKPVQISIDALKAQIHLAIQQNPDWSKVPVAIFETEIALKRIQAALDKVKEAVAHDEAMDVD